MSAMQRFWDKVDKSGECWLWTAGKSHGYGYIWIADRMVRAHRVSWELHYGPIPDGLFVLHDCDVPACVRPDHLWLGTNQDNLSDMARKGRGKNQGACGEDHASSKLSEKDVILIRNLNATNIEIAKMFGVCKATISHIKTRRNWRHV